MYSYIHHQFSQNPTLRKMHPLLCQGTLKKFCYQFLIILVHLMTIIIYTRKPQFQIKMWKIITQLCRCLTSYHWWPFVKCCLTRPITCDVCIISLGFLLLNSSGRNIVLLKQNCFFSFLR